MIVGKHHRVKLVRRELHAACVLSRLSGQSGVYDVVLSAEFHEERHAVLREQLVVNRSIVDKADKLQGITPP